MGWVRSVLQIKCGVWKDKQAGRKKNSVNLHYGNDQSGNLALLLEFFKL